jgi:hypothetical protein
MRLAVRLLVLLLLSALPLFACSDDPNKPDLSLDVITTADRGAPGPDLSKIDAGPVADLPTTDRSTTDLPTIDGPKPDLMPAGTYPHHELVSGAAVSTGGSYTLVSEVGVSWTGGETLAGGPYLMAWNAVVIPW